MTLDIRLPVNRTLGVRTFNLPAGDTCPGRSPWCLAHCYACKGQFVSYPSVAESHDANWRATEDLAAFADAMVERLATWRPGSMLRVHSSGDFYSVDYARAWADIARRSPHVRFAAYTRTWRIPAFREALEELESVSNFCLWWSQDPSTGCPTDAPRRSSIVDPDFAHVVGPRLEPNCAKQMDHNANCRSCGLCWDKTRCSVVFRKH